MALNGIEKTPKIKSLNTSCLGEVVTTPLEHHS